jgi:ABC-type Fe3+-siderophore transport system permease subunit
MDIEWMRVLLAFFCGYFLTLSGSLSQIVTNNKLASSSTLGFDGLAVLMVLCAQFLITFVHLSFPIEP